MYISQYTYLIYTCTLYIYFVYSTRHKQNIMNMKFISLASKQKQSKQSVRSGEHKITCFGKNDDITVVA